MSSLPSGAPSDPPPCPLTGAPAARYIQRISRRFLADLWRYSHGVDVSRLLVGVDAVTLWAAPCGLAFFHPMIAGDRRFYEDFYIASRWHRYLEDRAGGRNDFKAASRFVNAGDAVLDVACGSGAFRQHVPGAAYTGLDPFVAAAEAGAGVIRETLEAHVARSPERYDVVCAFHFVEHVAHPRTLVATMLHALKPGGLLFLAAPIWPSPMTEIPNLVLNAPPHHVTWWSEGAYRTLCEQFGLAVVEIAPVAAYSVQAPIYWMHRCSWVKARERSYRASYGWHASLIAAYALSRIITPLRGLPTAPPAFDIVLAARKPGADAP